MGYARSCVVDAETSGTETVYNGSRSEMKASHAPAKAGCTACAVGKFELEVVPVTRTERFARNDEPVDSSLLEPPRRITRPYFCPVLRR